jgi:hypothetical protein
VVADARDEERPGGVELAGVERLARLGAERQELGAGVDVAAALADHFGELVGVDLLQSHQLFIALGLLELVQAFALQVFDQLDLEHLLVAQLAHRGDDVGDPGFLGGEPAALAGDELELGQASQRLERPHHDGLQDADLPDALGELGEALLREALAAQRLDVGLARRDRRERDGVDLVEQALLCWCVHAVPLAVARRRVRVRPQRPPARRW